MTAAMQEDFEQADDAGVVDLDPGIADRADGDRQGEALQLVAQEGGELFVLLEEGVLEVGAEDVMTVLNAIDDGGQLAAHPAVQAGAEDLSDFVCRQAP